MVTDNSISCISAYEYNWKYLPTSPSQKKSKKPQVSSKYIGVTKNGKNWQVKINKGKFKNYLGTFKGEKEAAIIHDFYRIVTELKYAKTNFTYPSYIILEMMKNYDPDTGYLDVRPFMKLVK